MYLHAFIPPLIFTKLDFCWQIKRWTHCTYFSAATDKNYALVKNKQMQNWSSRQRSYYPWFHQKIRKKSAVSEGNVWRLKRCQDQRWATSTTDGKNILLTTEGARGREGRGRQCPRGGHGLGLATGTAVETGLGPSRQTGRPAPPKAAGTGRGVVEVVKLRKGMVMRYVFWQLTSFNCL